MTRSPSSSREFRAYFEKVVRTSNTRIEAARELGYLDTKTVWYHMKRLGIQAPPQWSLRPHLRLVAQRGISVIAISTLEGRHWVTALIQGEGCIQSIYRKCSHTTYLQLDIGMADPAPIFRLSDYLGVRRPTKPSKNHQWMPLWRKSIAGLRSPSRIARDTSIPSGPEAKGSRKGSGLLQSRRISQWMLQEWRHLVSRRFSS